MLPTHNSQLITLNFPTGPAEIRHARLIRVDTRSSQASPNPPFAERWQPHLLGAILILGFAIRLYHVTYPPVDFHSWRDSMGFMVARNFCREGMNLFSPSVDWRPVWKTVEKGTMGGGEMQVTPYLVACLYRVFGIRYWVGRIVPIAFSLLGVALFHRLVNRLWGPACAAMAALLLTCSPYFVYIGRNLMPEAFAFAMAFGGLFHWDRWLVSKRGRDLRLATACCTLMILGKPQLCPYLLAFAYLALARLGWRAFIERRAYVFAVLVLLPAAMFLYYSLVIMPPLSGITLASQGHFGLWRLRGAEYYAKMADSIWRVSLTPAVCILAMAGLVRKPRDAAGGLAHAWALSAFAFFLLMPGGNIANGYYQMMLVPAACALTARALEWGMRGPWLRSAAFLVLAGTSGYGLYVAAPMFEPVHANVVRCGDWIRENTPDDALAVTSSGNPAVLYLADRPGWACWMDSQGKIEFNHDLLEKVGGMGASILAITDTWFDNAWYPQYQHIRDDLYDSMDCHHGDGFVVFSLRAPADLSLPAGGPLIFGTPETRKYLRGHWGPDQGNAENGTFAAMGPAKRSSITFAADGPLTRLAIEVASAVPDQTLSLAVNGEDMGELAMPVARRHAGIDIGDLPPPDDSGTYEVVLGASRQNASGASLLLYSVRASSGTAGH